MADNKKGPEPDLLVDRNEINKINLANIEVFLFDWGDTLMVDFPGMPGKMCDWDKVEAIEGAQEVLEKLSQRAHIYIATGAANSVESEIERAFARVGLNRFISGYFCKSNLGLSKGSAEFLPAILAQLNKSADKVAMVGDNLQKDIVPAAAIGIQPIWFLSNMDRDEQLKAAHAEQLPSNIGVITELRELCE